MKWDIWDSHYPAHVIVSDAIRSGQFPLWNPLYNFGTPYYAIIGSPVWYPFTLFFDIVGYTPVTPAWEYCLHIFIGSFGTFLLCSDLICESTERYSVAELASCLVSGVIYGFSGTYLSNAEHIMIIISISWIPYVMLFARKYIKSKKIVYAMFSGICAGMILLGGYPEIFYDLFIVLCLWLGVYYLNHHHISILKEIFDLVKSMFLIGFFTVCSAAITLIPFLNVMHRITRSGGQIVTSNPLTSFMTMLIPGTADVLSGNEISMGCYYMGIITVLLIPLVIKRGEDGRVYAGLGAVILLLSLGNNSFLHPILYRFLPMYSIFRFASLWRPFATICMLIADAPVIVDLINGDGRLREYIVSYLKKAIACFGVFAVICYIISRIANDGVNIANTELLADSFVLLTLILSLYFVHFWGAYSRNRISSLTFVLIVCFECLMIAYKMFPLTIGIYGQTDGLSDKEKSLHIQAEISDYHNRNTNCNFANNSRSSNGLNSKPIAVNKTFDEDGYLSILLSKVQNYKTSQNRVVIAGNPEVYFTDDYVSSNEIDLADWLDDKSVRYTQVFVDSNSFRQEQPSREVVFQDVKPSFFGFNSIDININALSDGFLTVLQTSYPGWKAYVDGKRVDIVEINGCFIGVPLKRGNHNVQLKFKPWDFVAGVAVSGLFYIWFIFVTIRHIRLRKLKKKQETGIT
jgi:hypothetical protein